MKELIRYNKYSRKDIHDIFSPGTKFTPGAGYWGISGIIRVPETKRDFIFLVTYGQSQAEHEFDEEIDENGILIWQSQQSQKLQTPQIIELINHNHIVDNIYLFLRTDKKSDYIYLGLLAYVTHDKEREKPVYFKWQILDWNGKRINRNVNELENSNYCYSQTNLDSEKFNIVLNEEEAIYTTVKPRQGKSTEEFYNNKKIDFEGEMKKNTELGKIGEDIVVKYEKEMLIKAGRADLSSKVIAIRNLAGNAERFDVLSYTESGEEKYIEVKTTKGELNNMFYISESEVNFSHEFGENYYLYRVYNLDVKTMSADLKIIRGPIEREKLIPTNYTCRIGGKDENI